MLTSTALTYYDSCYSSDPESVTGLKVTEGDGKLNVVGGSYTEYGTDYACTGAIEKLGDNTMFNLKCTNDGDVETITLKGLKENPVKPDAAMEAAVAPPGSKGKAGGPSVDMDYGDVDDEWAELGDEFEEAMEEAAEELEAAFEELGNALEGLEW